MASKWENILGNDGVSVFDWTAPQNGVSSLFVGEILLDASFERENITIKNGSSAYSQNALSDINNTLTLLLNQWTTLFSQYRNLNSLDLDTWDGSFSVSPPVNKEVYAVEQIEIYTGVGMQLIKDFYTNGGVYAVAGIFAEVDFIKYAYYIISSMKEKIKVPTRGGYSGGTAIASSPSNLNFAYNNNGVGQFDTANDVYGDTVLQSPPTGIFSRKYFTDKNRYSYNHRPYHLGTTSFGEGALVAGLSPYMHGTVSATPLLFTEPSTFRAFNTGYTEGEKVSKLMPLNSDGTSYTNTFYNSSVSNVIGDITDTYIINTQEGFRVDHDFITYYIDTSSLLEYYTP